MLPHWKYLEKARQGFQIGHEAMQAMHEEENDDKIAKKSYDGEKNSSDLTIGQGRGSISNFNVYFCIDLSGRGTASRDALKTPETSFISYK